MMMDDTDTDLETMDDPALLSRKHDLAVSLSIDPDADTMMKLARVEREVARRVSGVIWTDARP
jgi:hypothetical protein